MALVLGAAFGPRATDVEVRDAASGSLVASGRAQHQDLGQEVDDPTAWWRSLMAAVAQAGEREIASIALCGGHPGLVLLDGAGAVLRPTVPWSQATPAGDAAQLRRSLGAERWAHDAGVIPGASTAVTRLAWLRRTEPETFARIGAALLPHDWLTYRLAGRPVTDRGSASLTGAWSPRTERWIPQVLGAIAPETSIDAWYRRLPSVLGPSERADWLTAPVYEMLGLRGRPLVAPGTGEPMAVALAMGLRPGRVGVSLGASTTVLAPVERPVTDASGAVRSRADATGGHLAITTAAGGAALVASVAQLLELDPAELADLAMAAGAETADVVLVPGVPSRVGGVLTGLGPGLGRRQLARAAYEGVACAALDGADLLSDAGAPGDPEEPLRVSGPAGGLLTHAQVLATLAGRPVVAVDGPSLAATGACIQAAAVLREEPPGAVVEAWAAGDGPVAEPLDDPGRVERRLRHAEESGRQRRAMLRADRPS